MSEEVEDELLDEVVELTPLSALDPDKVDELTPLQRNFLIAFISNGSIPMARKIAKVSSDVWKRWQDDEKFQAIFKVVKSPPAFAGALRDAIVWKAMLELYSMFGHEKIGVRQWAIERAFQLMPKEEGNSGGGGQAILSQRDVKLLAESLNEQLSDEAKDKVLRKQPFQIVDATFEVVNE